MKEGKKQEGHADSEKERGGGGQRGWNDLGVQFTTTSPFSRAPRVLLLVWRFAGRARTKCHTLSSCNSRRFSQCWRRKPESLLEEHPAPGEDGHHPVLSCVSAWCPSLCPIS